MAGANLIYGAGMIESGVTFDCAQFVIDNEIARMIRRVAGGIRVDDETLAVDDIHSVGPFGDFLSLDSTYRHMRDLTQPEILDRRTREEWQERGSRDLYAEALVKARGIVRRAPARAAARRRGGADPRHRRRDRPRRRRHRRRRLRRGRRWPLDRSCSPEGARSGRSARSSRRCCFRFDLVFFTIAAFISLDTIAVTAAYGGGQTFFWLAFLIIVYLIPYGMIIAEMGSAFPVEGGPYAWVRMAFGRLAGSYTAVIYWGSNPVWIGGTLAATTVAAINSLIVRDNPLSTCWSIVVGLVVVWVTVMLSMIEMKYGKWTGIIGTIVRLLTLFIFLALVIIFLVQHGKPAGTVTVADMKPTLVGFLGVIGLLQFMFVGFELSSGASEEMTDPQKDVPKMIIRSGLIAALITGSMILGVLLVMNGDAL